MVKYNWEGTGYPSGKDDRTKIEKNNEKIHLNVLHAQKKKRKIYCACLSNHDSKHEKQVINLRIKDK